MSRHLIQFRISVSSIRNSIAVFLFAIFSFILIIIGCQGPLQPAEQIAIALLNDTSVSAEENGVPTIDPDAVDRLIAILKARGGVLAFCEINAQSRNQPLLRVHLDATAGNLQERALANQKNRRKLEQFRTGIEKSLQARKAQKSDILGALSRTAVFFAEPPIARMQRVLILISDGEHDAPPIAMPELPSDLVVIAIGMPTDIAEKFFGKEVNIFESVDGALAYLESTDGYPSKTIEE